MLHHLWATPHDWHTGLLLMPFKETRVWDSHPEQPADLSQSADCAVAPAAEMTDEAMVVFLLKHLRPSVPFLVSSERLQRKYLKQVLQLFGGSTTRVRVQAVLFLRQMAVTLPPPFLSSAMKVRSPVVDQLQTLDSTANCEIQNLL